MNPLSCHSSANSSPLSLSIARSAFQFILHQALQAAEQQTSYGLLGSKISSKHCIEYISMLPVASTMDTSSCWQAEDVVCMGLVHLHGEQVSEAMLACVPKHYVELAVCLDEKGRLDLFAFQCVLGSDEKIACAVTMIEDGQALANG
ncbi:MAG: hypothetical protein R8M45_02365 [Ghiorsea sp.]